MLECKAMDESNSKARVCRPLYLENTERVGGEESGVDSRWRGGYFCLLSKNMSLMGS